MQVQLLGEFRVVYGDVAVAINAHRLQSLLAYLILHRGAPQPRRHLAFLLWPDTSEAQAHTNLRNLVHLLRRALPEADRFLHADSLTLQWRPDAPCVVDVVAFEDALARGALREAVRHYRGDLLPGCYDDWVTPERERLRQDFTGALERLLHEAEAERDYATATIYAQRLLQQDPLREEPYGHLIRLYALRGDRAAALRTYHACATLLGRELGVEPGPAIRSAYERLLEAGAQAPPAPLAAALPLVGRDEAWARLLGAWRAAPSSAGTPGGARLLLVTGEAGIGKTRLVEELLAWTARQGILAAVAHCYAAEGSLAYAPLAAWVQALPLPALEPVWLTEVARLRPALLAERPGLAAPGPLVEAWQRSRLFEALARAALAAGQPLLLVLEDVQWCDRDTLEWLHYLLRFDPKAPLLVVATLRAEEVGADHPVWALRAALEHKGQFVGVELGPLGAADTATLAGHAAGRALAPPLAARLYRETEGNPLFVVECVRAGLHDAAPGPELAGLPPRVQAVVGARLAQLSPPARDLVGLAATVGREFTFAVLRLASDVDEDSLVRALDELWQRRIVREQGPDGYDFAHDLLREAAYAGLSSARRRLLHRRVAEALVEVHSGEPGPFAAQVAAHYEQANLAEPAAAWYRRAAVAARRIFANAEALRCLERALALLPEGSADVAAVQEERGDVLQLTARNDEARQAYRCAQEAIAPGATLACARLERKVGASWLAQHAYEEAERSFAQAEGVLGDAPPAADPAWWQEWLEIRRERMVRCYQAGEWRELEGLAADSRPAFERHGSPTQRAQFVSVAVVGAAFWRDRWRVSAETVAEAHRMIAVAQETADPHQIARARVVMGLALLFHDDLAQAEQEFRAGLTTGEQCGDVVMQLRSLTYLGILERRRGHVEEARGYAGRALALAEASGHGEYVASARACGAWAAWRRGRAGEAETLAGAALEAWRGVPFLLKWTALWTLMAIELPRGEVATALEHARALLDPLQQRLPDSLATAVAAAIAAGSPGEAGTHLQRALELAQEMGYL